jgi:multimeric flavodoxin WrbA
MNSLTKFILKLCFGIWLLTSILPEVIQNDYKVVFLVGKGLLSVVFVLALFAFFKPLFRKKKQMAATNGKTTLVLHDLDNETAEKLFCDVPNAQVFSARKKMAKCIGCFGCWLRTPGLCIIHDGTEFLGKQIGCCDEFIIISKCLYGGFSREIKNALDRLIAFVLPFFEVNNREQHHQARYPKSGKLKAYIYNSSEISDTDKTIVTEITKANSVNMKKSSYETIFVNDVQGLKGALS